MDHRIVQVIYEDNHLIAVNKPPGYLVHSDGGEGPVLADWVKNYIKEKYGKPGDVFLGVVHRIDRPVSGVVVFARTSKALARMNELFRQKMVHKTYFALSRYLSPEESGTLIHHIVKDQARNKATAYGTINLKKHPEAKEAVLHYAHCMHIANLHMYRINPDTGRPHQIRAQMAAIQCPIKGDVKYGDTAPNKDLSIGLHCYRISFSHPVKKIPLAIEAPLPKSEGWQFFRPVLED